MKGFLISAFKFQLSAFLLIGLSLPLAAAGKKNAHRKAAAAKPAGPTLPGQKVTFPTKDGMVLTGQFVPPNDHLTFLLLHGVGSSKGEWAAFATRLAGEGYGVLAYDGRGHAESAMQAGQKLSWRKFRSTGTDNEWNQMQNDVDAALVFLSSAGVQSSSVAFGGASIGANIMLIAAVTHPEARLAVLLSPGINYRDVMTVNPIRKYGKRPLLVAAATTDNYAFQSSQLLYNLAVSVAGPDNTLFLQTDAGHGAPILDNAAMMDAVISWIRAEEKGEPFTLIAPSTPTVATGSPAAPAKP